MMPAHWRRDRAARTTGRPSCQPETRHPCDLRWGEVAELKGVVLATVAPDAGVLPPERDVG